MRQTAGCHDGANRVKVSLSSPDQSSAQTPRRFLDRPVDVQGENWNIPRPDDERLAHEHSGWHTDAGNMKYARALFERSKRLWRSFCHGLCIGEWSPRRKALTVTLASLTLWSVWNAARTTDSPWGDLSRGVFTDHFSHMNAARAFTRVGLDLWRKPIAEMFRPLTAAERARMPADVRPSTSTGGVYFVPGWPESKPLATGWSHKTRMYPPGDLLFVAPIAAAYHFTPMSFQTACRLLLAWFILAAHAALYWFLLAYFEGPHSGIELLGLFFLYSCMMRWTLEGFYDCAAMIPLALCARYLRQRRSLAAIVTYCVGAFVHFRVFFLAPWALYAAFLVLKDRAWRQWTRRAVPALAVAVGCAATSLYVFWLDLPFLRSSGVNNLLLLSSPDPNVTMNHDLFVCDIMGHLMLKSPGFDVSMAWNLVIILAVCGGLFLWSRAWLDAVVVGWLGLILFNLREIYWWHLLIPMSWIGAPAHREIVRVVRLLFFVTVAALALHESLAPTWLWLLFRPQ